MAESEETLPGIVRPGGPTIREILAKCKELPEDIRPLHYITGPGPYSMLGGMTDGLNIEVLPNKDSAMARADELSTENKKWCMLMGNQGLIYAPQPNGNVRCACVYINGQEVLWRYMTAETDGSPDMKVR